MTGNHRIEKDSMGEMHIPSNCLYGAQTERARRNFPISNLQFGRGFIQALGAIKLAASKVNQELGLLAVSYTHLTLPTNREV
mgnify:CR=1 FL=1